MSSNDPPYPYNTFIVQPKKMQLCNNQIPGCISTVTNSNPYNYSACGYTTGDYHCILPCDQSCGQSTYMDAFDGSYTDVAPQTQVAYNNQGQSTTNCNLKTNECLCSYSDPKKSCGACSNVPIKGTVFQKCLYNSANFTNATTQDLNNFNLDTVDVAGRNHDEFMTHWCSARVNQNCPKDPLNSNTTPPYCPRYFSTGDEGQQCTTWISNKKSPKTKSYYTDAMGSIYCTRYPTDQACACVNRGIGTPTQWPYVKLKQNAPYNDGCWYSPCMSGIGTSNFYFQPSDVNVSVNTSAQCPTDICLNFFNSSGYNQTYFNENKAYTDC